MSTSSRVVFFLSTGRCGTQWVCNTLQNEYANYAETTHEPVRAPCHARRYLRQPSEFTSADTDPDLTAHRIRIEEALTRGHYIETGWPCFALLPWWIKHFGDRLSIVHMVRHPILNALSLATQDMYQRNDWIAAMALSPEDPGVVHADVAPPWSQWTNYQKCLYFLDRGAPVRPGASRRALSGAVLDDPVRGSLR